jgi:hypothetical protein
VERLYAAGLRLGVVDRRETTVQAFRANPVRDQPSRNGGVGEDFSDFKPTTPSADGGDVGGGEVVHVGSVGKVQDSKVFSPQKFVKRYF